MYNPRWRLYCEAGLAGEAEYIRIMFQDSGVLYVEINDPAKLDAVFGGGKLEGWPCFTHPMVERVEGSHISETNAICKYLCKQFGMVPVTPLEEAKSDQVFHEARKFGNAIQKFADADDEGGASGELSKFLQHFNAVLASNRGGSGLYVAGMKPSYGDFGLLHSLRMVEQRFPDLFASSTVDLELLRAFKARMESRPKLAAYFKSDQCKPTFDGYPKPEPEPEPPAEEGGGDE